jgi:hypothetical protein
VIVGGGRNRLWSDLVGKINIDGLVTGNGNVNPFYMAVLVAHHRLVLSGGDIGDRQDGIPGEGSEIIGAPVDDDA